ncbi:MAG: PilX N-terminal domain-containing pilus assembly protein [Syntrophus sp. (in: bacteria)]|nr:PilX N-terminal domain-containing pilus assembly protein [Syntrophus sp. (in: bacteria)]
MRIEHERQRKHLMVDEKGMTLVTALIVMAALMLLGTTAMLNISTDLKISGNFKSGEQTLYAAEAGAEYGVNRLREALKVLNGPTTGVVPPAISGFSFQNTGTFLATDSTVTEKTMTGAYDGLTAYCQAYTITSTALKNGTNARATVVYKMEDQLIPLFQFGIFYENDLEMLPGGDMTFTGGRIHSNKDIYMRPWGSKTLKVDSIITSAGDIVHQRKDYTDTSGAGAVKIKDSTGTYQSLTTDSSSGTWKADALDNWDGRVKTSDHGIQKLNLPLSTTAGEPIDILGTGTDSLYVKSGLRIVNGAAYDRYGTNITSSLPTGTITTKTFKDGRENKWMTAVEVDVSLLKSSTTAMAALNDPPSGGENGILYVSSNSVTNPAVRLVNGSEMPSDGLSVVTNNPLYIKGDYNTNNDPAGIFADAVTVLSNNWSDANSTSGLSSRTASSTEVNAAIMTGNKNTAGSQYSGGVENLIRFLENWSGKTYTYSGSLTCLWESQQATGNWPGTGTVYNPPTRNWSYGVSLSNLPPGTPRVRNLERTSWHQVSN